MTDLPAGWSWTRIADVAETQLGKMLSQASKVGDDPRPYLRNQNVQWGRIDLRDVAAMDFTELEMARYSLRAGDLVVCEGGEVGRAAVWPEAAPECFFQKAIHRVRPCPGVDASYIRYALEAMARSGHLTPFISGSTIKHLPQEDLRLLPLPLAPREEQRRIADELERRLSHVDAAVAGLTAARRRLAAAREYMIWSLVLPGGRVTDTALPSLPEGWHWSTLGDVAQVVGGVTKDAKHQSNPDFAEVPYLRVANVQRGYLSLDDLLTIRVPKDKAVALRLEPGDILFNEGGDRDKLGRGWVWEGQVDDCIHQNHVFRARLTEERLEPKFVSWVGNTFGRRWFEAAGKQTTNLASLNLTNLKAFPVPVPPAGMAAALVEEGERRLSLISAAGRTIDLSLLKAEQLRRSLLAAAFSGRLVLQNPDDEPASVLLDRIRAERAATPSAPKRRRRKKESPA